MKLGLSPSDGVLDIAHARFVAAVFAPILRFLSLPADLSKRFPARYHTARSSASSSSEGDRPRMSLSQARLIIPRSPSEYKACCRFARSHSEGLLLSSTPQRQLTDALKGSRRLEPKAFSETLMGGKMIPFLLDA